MIFLNEGEGVGRGVARQHRYDDTRKTALKACDKAGRGGGRHGGMCAFYGAITLSSAHKTRFFLFFHSAIHLEVFVPSHFHHPPSFHRIFSFLSAKTHATTVEEKAQIEDAETTEEGRREK